PGEPAVAAAAVTGSGIAVIALLVPLDHAVAADRGDRQLAGVAAGVVVDAVAVITGFRGFDDTVAAQRVLGGGTRGERDREEQREPGERGAGEGHGASWASDRRFGLAGPMPQAGRRLETIRRHRGRSPASR